MIEWRLHLRMAERRLKIVDVCNITGLNQITVSKLYHGKDVKGVDMNTLEALCKGLELESITELMEYISDNASK
ncbi:helix-turn-helix domain-containing protein [Alicyclobacillus fodiniaquatilis]|uniref:Helix-turn-helix domain-containing protein n=1 Tax=Alicyclobacillus fodiniaquatilis TaxID=1661150 RepID=A0ABW4JI63_9BACL